MHDISTLQRRMRRFLDRVRFEWIAQYPPYQDSLQRGHAARARLDWVEAGKQFALAAKVRPDSPGVRLQLGHALKETGDVQGAEACYREAVRQAPRSPDAHIHLGHALKILGRRSESIEAYARAVALAPLDATARGELIAAGGGDRLAKGVPAQTSSAGAFDRLERGLADVNQALELLSDATSFSINDWAGFRRACPLPAAPHHLGPDRACLIFLDARDIRPSVLRSTLAALMEQTFGDWKAVVLVDPARLGHPVAGLQNRDDRLHMVSTVAEARSVGQQNHADTDVVLMAPDAVLDSRGLEWLRFAALSGPEEADASYGDHDHHSLHWRDGPAWSAPVMFPAPGSNDLATTPQCPAVVYLTRASLPQILDQIEQSSANETRRHRLVSLAREQGRLSHTPLMLSSVFIRADASSEPAFAPSPSVSADKIRVIVPTRDQAGLLEACVRTLRNLALRPELLEILVLDNRSQEPETAALLAKLVKVGEVRVENADEPFNWSRLNNSGASGVKSGILVFANNDIEMISLGWDEEIRRLLADDQTGVVGARLLYPDGTIQHAGVVLGAVSGRPVHEGRAAGPKDGGPSMRWLRNREAAAVTGAFLAVTADTFARVGGFDEGLSIAYNDIDFCLRARRAGLAVVYAATIEAVHHESKTRGLGLTAEKIAWDDLEFADLYRQWGEACIEDPFVHPSWIFAAEGAHVGVRALRQRQIVAAIKAPVRVTLAADDHTGDS